MGKEIQERKMLLVEGKDEVNFCTAFLHYLQIGNVRVEEVGGKDQFPAKFRDIVKLESFSHVEILAIIRDAEENAQSAFQSITDLLKKYDMPVPSQPAQFSRKRPKVGIFIMPGFSEQGMLEDLCLKTVAQHPAMKCVEQFADCVAALPEPPKIMSKAKSQAFLAAMPEIANSLGVGAKKGYWNFEARALAKLRKFLAKLGE